MDKKMDASSSSMITCENNNSFLVIFVLDDLNSAPSKIIYESCEIMKSKKFSIKWRGFDRLKSMEFTNKTMLVIDKFEGSTFEYFKNKMIRIVSPLVIIYCNQENVPMPIRDHPIYSCCMYDLEITCTGLPLEKRKSIEEKVKLMSGSCYPKLHNRISFLISDSVLTKKYRAANQYSIPVMNVAWVEECWLEYQHKYLRADDPTIISKHRLPFFTGLNITVSGLSEVERNKVKEIIESQGATYHKALNLKPVMPNTILIVKDEKDKKGEKYKYARKYSIPCIRLEWIYDSVAHQYALPIEDYNIDLIAPIRQDFSSLNNCENNVVINTPEQQKQQQQPSTSKNFNKPKSLPEALSQLVVKSQNTKILEDRNIHAIGFDNIIIGLIKFIVKSCGAFYYTELQPLVTDVIVGSEINEATFKNLLNNFADRLVKIEWLLNCIESNKICPHDKYLVNSLSQISSINISKDLDQNKSSTVNVLINNNNNNKPSPIKLSPLKKIDFLKEPDKVIAMLNSNAPHKQINNRAKINDSDTSTQTNEESIVIRRVGENDDDDDDEGPVYWSPRESCLDLAKEPTTTSRLATKRDFNNENSCPIKKSRESNEINPDPETNCNGHDFDLEDDEDLLLIANQIKSNEMNLKKPCLTFSAFEHEFKIKFIEIITNSLSVKIHDDPIVTDDVTHLILNNPCSTEKTLAVIAANIWILRPEYINDSIKAKKLLPEYDYQWGLLFENHDDPNKLAPGNRLVLSALHWKNHLDGIKRKMFDGEKYLFLSNESKSYPISNILRAGGAQLYFLEDIQHNDLILLLPKIRFILLNEKFRNKSLCSKLPKMKILKYANEIKNRLYWSKIIAEYIINGPNGSIDQLKASYAITLNDI